MTTPTLKDILPLLNHTRHPNQTIVLVTGVFDILHQEHLNFLTKAKHAGTFLVVGIESDLRVRQLKGKGRPVNNQDTRYVHLHQLHIADLIFLLPEKFDTPEDHERLIFQIKPAILAVSSHSPHLDKKQQIMEKFGGNVQIVHQHNPAISTTNLINQKLSILEHTTTPDPLHKKP